MSKLPQHRLPAFRHTLTIRALNAIERFVHIEAMSGVILVIAAAAALIWVNSSHGATYEQFWHTPFGIHFGSFSASWDLRFWVNDVLMTVFFLVAGMEIRSEIHEGALSNLKQASLPVIAALGGVAMPAIIYSLFNFDPISLHGWAIPTATDIAFAVGILALLGKSVPVNVRIILLSLAIIDDVIAVLIIAIFYSGGLDINGLMIGCFAILLALFIQWIGISSTWIYCLPGAILWWGLYKGGIHPSLAGVILGMLTPALPGPSREAPLKRLQTAVNILQDQDKKDSIDHDVVAYALKELHVGQRKLLASVIRMQMTLRPWVLFGIMPLFAFANAGVAFSGIHFHENGAGFIATGVILGLFIGKPFGVFMAAFLAVKAGLCRLPPQVNWGGVLLVGLLAGIGFTMAFFVAMLAFENPNQLAAAKTAVLFGSTLSATISLVYGIFYIHRLKKHK